MCYAPDGWANFMSVWLPLFLHLSTAAASGESATNSVSVKAINLNFVSIVRYEAVIEI